MEGHEAEAGVCDCPGAPFLILFISFYWNGDGTKCDLFIIFCGAPILFLPIPNMPNCCRTLALSWTECWRFSGHGRGMSRWRFPISTDSSCIYFKYLQILQIFTQRQSHTYMHMNTYVQIDNFNSYTFSLAFQVQRMTSNPSNPSEPPRLWAWTSPEPWPTLW